MPTYVLTIGGTTKVPQQGWEIRDVANGIGTMRLEVLSQDGTYVPALDAEEIFTEDGPRVFGGNITGTFERGAGGLGIPAIETDVTASDFNLLAARRYFADPIPAGTLKAALTQLVPYIPGATLHASQADGPSLPDLLYDAWKVEDILNDFTTRTGYLWTIDYNKVLRMYPVGFLVAPFNLAVGDGNAIGDVTSEPTRTGFATRVLLYGTGVFAIQEDGPSIAAGNFWELKVLAPDTTTQGDADTLAAAVLGVAFAASIKRVTYHTYRAGLVAGQTQSIVLPTRHLNNTFLITDVVTRDVGRKDKVPLRTVTALEGLVYQTGWRDELKQWGGGGGMTVGGSGGSPVVAGGKVYFLGGSMVEWVQWPTSTWIAASAMQVTLDTVALGTASFSAKVRARARAGNVTVRLQNVSDNLTVGTSGVVSSSSWQDASFAVTLTAGSKLYELQVLPSLGDTDVAAVGYMESL